MKAIERFRSSYETTPPWDIGKPQKAIIEITKEISGSVLDCGCGTGENVIYIASIGYDVTGIDGSSTAIKIARTKAKKKKVKAKFIVGDALKLGNLKKKFDVIVDSALFHVLSDEERAEYERSLKSSLKKGGTYFMLCFSEKEKREGPRSVSKKEIRECFSKGWKINYIRDSAFETNIQEHGAKAYIASITKL